ncbi:MAG: glycosyltransferase family 4 protein [Thermodesulfobacteriota bacterium]
MKVFHITDRLPGYHGMWGGAEQAAYRAVKLLCGAKGVENRVVAMPPLKEVNEGFGFHAVKSMEYYLGERLEFLASGFKNRGLPFDPVSFFSSYRLFKRERPDVVHVHKANLLSFSVIQSAILLKIPIILSIYDYWYFCPAAALVTVEGRLCRKFHGLRCIQCNAFKDFGVVSKVMLLLRWKWFFDYYYRRIAAFVVLSRSSAEILKEYGIDGKKIHVIHQAFPLTNWDAAAPVEMEDNLIFFAGWMDEKKGLHVLIDAMPLVLKEVPEAKLRVFELKAEKAYREKIQKKIDEYGINKSVTVHGRLDAGEFRGYLKKANVVVVPEQWENMSPVIIVEAMATAKPIVAGRIGGIPEFIEDGVSGLLAEYDNPKDFAEKIVRVLKDKKKAVEMGARAREAALKAFNEDAISNELVSLYNKTA